MPYPPSPTPPALLSAPRSSRRFVHRLGPHHFAHLRACAEGLEVSDCARRYLGIAHGHEARAAHQEAVDAVRAVARRRGESAWRLVGLTIRTLEGETLPSLESFVAQHGLDGFSESEVVKLYAEAFAADRKTSRGQRLRERQLALLRRLEGLAAETPQLGDLVAGWFDELLAAKLVTAGLLTLGALNARISAGGRWFASLPAVGIAKARRIERHLATLLPREVQSAKPLFTLSTTPALFGAPSPARQSGASSTHADSTPGHLILDEAPHTVLARPLLDANSDRQAVQSWIQARAGSLATVRVYQREAHRLLLWRQYVSHEGRCATLAQMWMLINDCGTFMAFLQNISPGWAPFRCQLSHANCRQVIMIIASMFPWLQLARY